MALTSRFVTTTPIWIQSSSVWQVKVIIHVNVSNLIAGCRNTENPTPRTPHGSDQQQSIQNHQTNEGAESQF